uniref:G-protein coupled receptors family 1 profile domain-containing protein n=1 Tax=Daphnia galeata TaxID=27404 RepID=A0A8J2RK24_9CRUS|nr:unnamed protein product [Daphnia galeata]
MNNSSSFQEEVVLTENGEIQTNPLCHAYVATIFVPQGLLLVNMLLALIDRYLAINHPLLHREKMTNRLACCLIVTCSILTVFLLKFVYIVGLSILRCELLLLHVRITLIIFIVLFVSCTAMNIVIYRQTKILLRESRTVETTRDEGTRVSNDSVTANNQHSTVVTPMSIHVGRKKLGQLEMEATQTLIMGVTSLCVMPCLSFVFMATFFACRLVFGQLECSNLNGIGYLIKEISLTPAVYGPIIFLHLSTQVIVIERQSLARTPQNQCEDILYDAILAPNSPELMYVQQARDL